MRKLKSTCLSLSNQILIFVLCIFFSMPLCAAEENKANSELLSLVELAPELIYTMRRYPSFYGDKNTVKGDILSRSQLFGNMGGVRDSLVDKGVNIDIGSTQVFQRNTSGGQGIGSRYAGSGDLYINLDSGKLGLWSGGNFFLHAETYWGHSIQPNVSSLIPVNYDSTMPDGDRKGASALSEAYLIQALPSNFMFLAGKINLGSVADTNVFANNERTQFMNTSLVINPILGVFAPTTTWAAGPMWAAKSGRYQGGLFVVNNAGSGAMKIDLNTLSIHNTTLGTQFVFSPKPGGLPGNYRIILVGSTKDVTDYAISDRVLWETIKGEEEVANKDNNYGIFLNFDQYLYMKDPKNKVGWGIFGRAGWAPKDRNVIDKFFSLGISGKGCLVPCRSMDTWGLGWSATHISGDFRKALNNLRVSFDSIEHAIEGYYNIELSPAIHFSFDMQYIINNAGAAFTGTETRDHAFVLGTRLQLDF
jgi:porin